MDDRLKQRLVGAAVLVSAAVILIPMFLRPATEPDVVGLAPRAADAAGTSKPGPFSSAVVPLAAPATPLLDARDEERRAARRREQTPSRPRPAGPITVPAATVAPAKPGAAAAPPTPPGGAWAVQLGSFANKRNALALRDRLRDSGHSAFVVTQVGEQGVITRVYVGPELDRDNARATIERLERETKLRGMVVRYPQG